MDVQSKLYSDPGHPVFNAIVGRYANRMSHGTFTIPDDVIGSKTFQVPTNDFNGRHTLHGGNCGWDRKTWTVHQKSGTSVTFQHIDTAEEGFPGVVTAFTTYSVENGGTLKTTIHATASEKTPIMLTQHIYWNLDAFQESSDILAHGLYIDSSQVIAVDDDAIPTGILANIEGTPFDFRTEQAIGGRWEETAGLCGQDHQGYNTCYILPDRPKGKFNISLSSKTSGIKLDISTNQKAVIVYTSFWMDTPRKDIHGGPLTKYGKHSAIAIEQQGWVDAINRPEWGVDQIYHPGRDYDWSSTYKFSSI